MKAIELLISLDNTDTLREELELVRKYARIQIEKDREYFIEKISYLKATHPSELVGIRMRYQARPIILD